MASLPPSLPPVETSNDSAFNSDPFTSSPANANGHTVDGSATSPVDGLRSAAAPAVQSAEVSKPHDTLDPKTQQAVKDVLYSDIGVNALLNRLKASLASARDFAAFLKRRAGLEEEHAHGMKKLSRSAIDAIHKQEARHESFQRQLELVMQANERVADNGSQFGLSLYQMQEDLLTLVNKIDQSRKSYKQQGLAAEKKVQDAETLAEKAKAKYDSLAEDYDRVKTGDTGAGRKFGLKGPKSAAQHEEDLHRKVQTADTDYAAKVQAAQTHRQELESSLRPQTVDALVDLVKETDAALTMQMQKYAAFNEKLLVNNGMVVSPQGAKDGSTSSMNQLIYQIDNDKDFETYILQQAGKVPTRRSEIKYEKHPTLAPTQVPPAAPAAARHSLQLSTAQPSSFQGPQRDSLQSPQQYQSSQQPPQAVQQPSFQTYNTGYQQQQPPQSSGHYSNLDQTATNPRATNQPQYQEPPYSRGFAGQTMAQQSTGVAYNNPPPVKPVFGLTLDELFKRDGTPVPMVVYQCIQGVDLYGLEVEGIYRIPGTASHIQAMKALFDSDASQVDFRNPEVFQHDVNSVAGLLKQFFRDLADPLLTKEHYQEFIDAARIDDETVRRDSMHAIINALPDPNYATLRALVLHLNRVQQRSEVNRMSTNNLGICWAPTVMGPHKGDNMADAGLQARVVISILDNVFQIFDED